MKKRANISILSIVIGIILVAGIIVGYSFIAVKPAIKLSCENGKFMGFGTTSSPLMCMVCTPSCYGEIDVRDSLGNLVCKSKSSQDSGKAINVPCLDLKEYKEKELTINYWVNSTSGNFSGKEKSIYGK